VNLWTILETLVPSSKNKSKVQNVCDSVIPILLLKYFNKLISNLFNDFNRWNEDIINSYIKGIDAKHSILKFALFLVCDQYSSERSQLYSELDSFVLLRNRAFKLSQILSKQEKISKSLERHEMNVLWQIRRVYRTRNMIVHSGKSPRYINILVENTHDYIDQVTSEIIAMTTSNFKINYLEQAFELGKILYSELKKQIKNSSKPEDYIEGIIR
jgi:hypothetical protein